MSAALMVIMFLTGASLFFAAAYLLWFEQEHETASLQSLLTEPPPSEQDGQPLNPDDEAAEVTTLTPLTLDDTTDVPSPASDIQRVRELGSTRRILFDADAYEPNTTPRPLLVLTSAMAHTRSRDPESAGTYVSAVLPDHHTYILASSNSNSKDNLELARKALQVITAAYRDESFSGNSQDTLQRNGAQLAAAMQMANRALWEHWSQQSETPSEGITLLAARFLPTQARCYIGLLGTGTAYRVRDGNLERMDTGPGETTGGAGIDSGVSVPILITRPEPGDHYLLCSEPLRDVSEFELAEAIERAPFVETAVGFVIQHLSNRQRVSMLAVRVTEVSTSGASPARRGQTRLG